MLGISKGDRGTEFCGRDHDARGAPHAAQSGTQGRQADRQKLLALTLSLCRSWTGARIAQSAERKALNLVVVGSSPTVGAETKEACSCASVTTTVVHIRTHHLLGVVPPKAIRCRNWLQPAAASTLGPHLSGGPRSRGTSAGGSRLLGQLQDMLHIAGRMVQKPA